VTKTRLTGLDAFRGWAVLLMMFFHFTYDLSYFKYIDINMRTNTFWVYERYVVVSIFLLSMGVSLALVHSAKIKWEKMYKRTLILGLASILISLATYIEFPYSWVYFGIIHFILLASWIGLSFLPYPKMALVTAVVILIGSAKGWLNEHWLFNLLQKPLHLPPTYTEDLLHPFPWLAAVLIGIAITRFGWSHTIFKHPFLTSKNRFNKLLSFFGRHALLVYLIHLPLLFGICMLLQR